MEYSHKKNKPMYLLFRASRTMANMSVFNPFKICQNSRLTKRMFKVKLFEFVRERSLVHAVLRQSIEGFELTSKSVLYWLPAGNGKKWKVFKMFHTKSLNVNINVLLTLTSRIVAVLWNTWQRWSPVRTERSRIEPPSEQSRLQYVPHWRIEEIPVIQTLN